MKHTKNIPESGRRSFLKASALLGSKLLIGASGVASLTNCSPRSEWRSIQYPKTLLDNFRLFDGIDNRLQKDLILLIEGDKILGIERKGDQAQYKNFKLIDLNGWTLLPGLIDNHVHLTSPYTITGNINTLRQKNDQFELNFRNCVMGGVTTVRDVGGFPGMIEKFKAKADKNNIPGPRVFSSLSLIAAREGLQMGWPEHAPYLEDPIIKWIIGGNFAERPRTVAEINDICQEMIRLGAVWLKTLHQDRSLHYKGHSLPNHTDEAYKVILANGKKHGIRCAMHAIFVSGFKKGVDLGYHTLEHTPMDAVIPDRYIDRFIENDGAILPTIKIFGDFFIPKKLLDLIETRGKDYLTPEAQRQTTQSIKTILAAEDGDLSDEQRSRLRGDPLYFKGMFPNVIRNVAKLKRAGAKIGIGTDSGGSPLAFF